MCRVCVLSPSKLGGGGGGGGVVSAGCTVFVPTVKHQFMVTEYFKNGHRCYCRWQRSM
jgi:hypothetical protein